MVSGRQVTKIGLSTTSNLANSIKDKDDAKPFTTSPSTTFSQFETMTTVKTKTIGDDQEPVIYDQNDDTTIPLVLDPAFTIILDDTSTQISTMNEKDIDKTSTGSTISRNANVTTTTMHEKTSSDFTLSSKSTSSSKGIDSEEKINISTVSTMTNASIEVWEIEIATIKVWEIEIATIKSMGTSNIHTKYFQMIVFALIYGIKIW